jgi:L-iditol 2-dehydrogenase
VPTHRAPTGDGPRTSFREEGIPIPYSQVIAPGRSEVIEGPNPVPGPGELLVKVSACGVCASDLHVWKAPNNGAPRRLGHEITGVVAGNGPGAYGWSRGALVTGFGSPGFADFAIMSANSVLPVPPNVAPEHALGEPLACQAETFKRTPFRAHDRVAIVGLGYMGLSFLQFARLTDPSALIAVDLLPGAREMALHFGATEAYHPDDVPPGYRAPENSFLPLDRRCQVVVEATGSADGLALAGDLVAPDGTLVVLGFHSSGLRKMDLSLWYKSVTIVNGFTPNRIRRLDAMAFALDLVSQRRVVLDPMITHRFGLDQVDEAYSLFATRPEGFVKSVIVP